jgi:hypothetical protein
MNSEIASLLRPFVRQRANTAADFASGIQWNRKSCGLKPDRQILVGHGPFVGSGEDWAVPKAAAADRGGVTRYPSFHLHLPPRQVSVVLKAPPMKATLQFLAVVMFATISQASSPFSHMKTGIELPNTIAGLTRGEVKSYEVSPGQSGVAIPYRNEEVEVTVFIRHIDSTKITSAAMVVEESLATVKQLEASGTYSNVKLFKATDDSGTPGWSKAAFTAKTNQAVLISLIYATIRDDYAIKARITTANPMNDSVQKFVVEFQRIVNDAKPKP